jgi:hypothetical protein
MDRRLTPRQRQMLEAAHEGALAADHRWHAGGGTLTDGQHFSLSIHFNGFDYRTCDILVRRGFLREEGDLLRPTGNGLDALRRTGYAVDAAHD